MKLSVLIIFLIIIPAELIHSQNSQPLIKLNGSVNLSTSYYSASGIDKRYPNGLSTAIVSSNINIADAIDIPLTAYISTDQVSYQQSINRIGANPKIGDWLTLHGGYFNSKLSDLTFGETGVMGAGFDVRYKLLRASFFYGNVRDAINPDSANSILGGFRREGLGFKLGIGTENARVDFNFYKAKDIQSSISDFKYPLAPTENMVMSYSFAFPVFGDKLKVNGEIGGSAYTSDTRYEDHPVEGFPSWLYNIKYSTRFDFGTFLNLSYTPQPEYSFSLKGKWYGPGFVTTGITEIQGDALDIEFSPNVRLMNNKLFLRSSFGVRYNNVRDTRTATTSRFIGSMSGTYQYSKNAGIDVSFMNYSIKSNAISDTARINNVLNYFTVTPRFNFEGLGGFNNLFFTYSFQKFDDNNIIFAYNNKSSSHSASAVWSLAFISSLNFSTSLNYQNSEFSTGNFKLSSLGGSAGYSFFNRKLNSSIGVNYSLFSSIADNNQLNLRLNFSYPVEKLGTISLYILRNEFNSDLNTNYKETQAVLQYYYNF
ncbi:MAG: hypothetical protein JSS63_09600 [Bacteroidetes bacterium]|nr:hypothetical protein [Bacteroidota bacterium]